MYNHTILLSEKPSLGSITQLNLASIYTHCSLYLFFIPFITVGTLHLFVWLFNPTWLLLWNSRRRKLWPSCWSLSLQGLTQCLAFSGYFVTNCWMNRWITERDPESETSRSSVLSTLPLWQRSPGLPQGPTLMLLILGNHLYSLIHPMNLSAYSVQGCGFTMMNTLY